jgi:hypothetical protein
MGKKIMQKIEKGPSELFFFFLVSFFPFSWNMFFKKDKRNIGVQRKEKPT